MKNFKDGYQISDRKWIVIICIALVLEVIWLLYDLQLISLPFLSSSKSKTNAVEAGYIIRSQEDVKKRSSDSLIWEPAKQNDVLYYRDSLLTLAQSSAVLYLKDQTELQMAENTLVTFEEPEAQSNAEIRLRFSKGDLKARNPYNISRIETADWVVNLEKGAEIALRKEEAGYEFEVLAGKATLDTEKGKEDLIESKIIKLGDDKNIETIEKSLELKWNNPQTERIYTADDKAKVAVEWKGSAQQLKISKPGGQEEPQTKAIKGQVAELELAPGNYQIRLEDASGISSPKQIEVKKAPKIYLKKPLPRDRIAIGKPMEFIWEGENSLKSYNLKLSNGQSYEVNENFKSLQFDQEQDIVWKIEAKDADGFNVPSLYESKVYLRHDTLAAPKLKTPKLIESESEKPGEPQKAQPAVKKDSTHIWRPLFQFVQQKLFFLYWGKAEAQILRKKNVVFEWDSVQGANQYIIEISSDPEFKNPEVVETLKNTSYTWKRYDPKKKYFWRVASGNSNGRMGLFSDPVPLEVIVEKTSQEKTESAVNAEVEAKAEKLAAEKAAAEKTAAAKKAQEEKKPEESLVQSGAEVKPLEGPLYSAYSRWRLAYAPAFKVASIAGDLNSKVELSGSVPVAFDFQYRTDASAERMYFTHFYLSSQKWKSKDTTGSVQQPDLNLTESFFSVRTGGPDSTWQYGIGGHLSFHGQRSGNFITNANLTFIGVEVAKAFSPAFTAEGAYLVSGEFSEAKLGGQYINYFSETEDVSKYFYGFGFVSALQSGPYGSGHQSQLQFLFGISGF